IEFILKQFLKPLSTGKGFLFSRFPNSSFHMQILKLFKDTYKSWDANDPWAKSAMIAYYALFSLPSVLIITIHFAGVFFGEDAVQGRITHEIEALIGTSSAELLQAIIINSALSTNSTF